MITSFVQRPVEAGYEQPGINEKYLIGFPEMCYNRRYDPADKHDAAHNTASRKGRAHVKKRKIRLSAVSTFHYVRLAYRSILFLTAAGFYIAFRIHAGPGISDWLAKTPVILGVIWVVYAVEMLLRFFPSRLESPGCQKQFAQNYIKTGQTQIDVQDNHGTVLVALLWICFNGVFGALHMLGVFDDGIMILISCAYAVCDMVCILFFCPFQTWFLKNKCCSACRIYNWDYAMMFTPLFFVKGLLSWSLLGLSLILLLRWEITFYRHPERFSEKTNGYLKCAVCTEKLCTHKTQLHTLWKQIEAFTAYRLRQLRK